MKLILISAVIGLFSGIISGLLGVGGGIVMVPAMVHFLNVPIKTAIGTSLAVIIPTALMGTYKHHNLGNVDWRIALTLIPMAILGSYGGAWLTSSLNGPQLKRIFGVFVIVVGARLLFTAK